MKNWSIVKSRPLRGDLKFLGCRRSKLTTSKTRNHRRSGLAPLPVRKRKVKKHAKRKANASVTTADKRQRVEETSKYLKENYPERRVRLVSDFDEDKSSRNMVCMSDLNNEGDPESRLDLTLSIPKLDSIETVQSQFVLQEFQEPKPSKTVMNEIMELISEPSGSKLLK